MGIIRGKVNVSPLGSFTIAGHVHRYIGFFTQPVGEAQHKAFRNMLYYEDGRLQSLWDL
jgi:hypothetical protein